MALVSYIYRNQPHDTLLPVHLAEDGRDGTFRGDRYDPLILAASGSRLTLYQAEADTEYLEQVRNALKWYLARLGGDSVPGDTVVRHRCPYTMRVEEYTVDEIRSLYRLFREAVEKGCRYAGRWELDEIVHYIGLW